MSVHENELPEPWARIPSMHRRVRMLADNEALFVEGGRSKGPWFLLDGCVELVRYGAPGERVRVHRATGGESFAEASIFTTCYHCDAIAATSSRVIGFTRNAVLECLEHDAAFALALAASLALDLQRTRRRVQLLSIRSAETRVREAIVDGLHAHGVGPLAETIGLSAEATSRALSSLVRQGELVRLARGRFALASDEPFE